MCTFLSNYFIEFIGVALVNKIIQVSGIQFYNTSSVYCLVCSPRKSSLLPPPFFLMPSLKGNRDVLFLELNLLNKEIRLGDFWGPFQLLMPRYYSQKEVMTLSNLIPSLSKGLRVRKGCVQVEACLLSSVQCFLDTPWHLFKLLTGQEGLPQYFFLNFQPGS